MENLLKEWRKELGDPLIFCPDGFLGEGSGEGKCRVIFICKESHVPKEGAKDDFFWLKAMVDGVCPVDKTYYPFCEKIAKDSYGISLRECAYININKEGGDASCDPKRLRKIAKKYKKFIRREIEFLVGEMRTVDIICCGTYGLVEKVVFGEDRPKAYHLHNYYHPAARLSFDKKTTEKTVS